MFFERFKQLCIENNISPTALLKKLNISTSKLTAWKNGSMPNSELLIPISEQLNVSIDFLLTGNNNFLMLEPEEQELLDIFRELPVMQKGIILGTARTTLNNVEGNTNNEEVG